MNAGYDTTMQRSVATAPLRGTSALAGPARGKEGPEPKCSTLGLGDPSQVPQILELLRATQKLPLPMYVWPWDALMQNKAAALELARICATTTAAVRYFDNYRPGLQAVLERYPNIRFCLTYGVTGADRIEDEYENLYDYLCEIVKKLDERKPDTVFIDQEHYKSLHFDYCFGCNPLLYGSWPRTAEHAEWIYIHHLLIKAIRKVCPDASIVFYSAGSASGGDRVPIEAIGSCANCSMYHPDDPLRDCAWAGRCRGIAQAIGVEATPTMAFGARIHPRTGAWEEVAKYPLSCEAERAQHIARWRPPVLFTWPGVRDVNHAVHLQAFAQALSELY